MLQARARAPGLVLALILAATCGQLTAAAASTSHHSSIDVSSKCPKLRIAVVNGVNFHFEVLAGILHVLQPYEHYVDVFVSPYIRTANFDGAWELLRWSKARFLRSSIDIKSIEQAYDLVVLVSPEDELAACRQLVTAMQPKTIVAFVHTGNLAEMPALLALAGPSTRLQLLAMSPHVSKTLAAAAKQPADWMLAVYPMDLTSSSKGCNDGIEVDGICIRGFAVQGKFSNQRRNYTSMWIQLQQAAPLLMQQPQQPQQPPLSQRFHLNVLGKGPDRLGLPLELQPLVTVHRRLQYKEFYDVIGHNLALIPALAGSRYFTIKFSSTIMTSLNTGTPIIATQQLLDAYSFLNRTTVFLQGAEEEEVDVMLRVLRMPAADIWQVRHNLLQLRDELNKRSFDMMEGYITQVCV